MRWRIFLSCLVMLALMGCSTIFDDFHVRDSPSAPDWIAEIDDSLTARGHVIHVAIDEGKIWETGNQLDMISRQIGLGLEVKIDGLQVPEENILIIAGLRSPVDVYNDEGNIIGSHGGLSHIYILAPDEPGFHTISLEISMFSGKTYAYTWEFEVKNTE